MAIRLFFRKEVEARLIVTLREIFKLDEDFPYSDNDMETSLMITPLYPKPDADNLQPHIVLTNIGYQFPLTTMFNNFEEQIKDPTTKKVTGYRYSTIVPVQAQCVCLSTVAGESEFLSDKLTDYLTTTTKTLLREQGFNIEGVQAGNAELRSPYPQFEYASGVSLTASVYYTWTETTGSTLPGVDETLRRIRLAISAYSG